MYALTSRQFSPSRLVKHDLASSRSVTGALLYALCPELRGTWEVPARGTVRRPFRPRAPVWWETNFCL